VLSAPADWWRTATTFGQQCRDARLADVIGFASELLQRRVRRPVEYDGEGPNLFLVGSARCADRTPQRGVPTSDIVKSCFAPCLRASKK
jgi:hypothetical protein